MVDIEDLEIRDQRATFPLAQGLVNCRREALSTVDGVTELAYRLGHDYFQPSHALSIEIKPLPVTGHDFAHVRQLL